MQEDMSNFRSPTVNYHCSLIDGNLRVTHFETVHDYLTRVYLIYKTTNMMMFCHYTAPMDELVRNQQTPFQPAIVHK